MRKILAFLIVLSSLSCMAWELDKLTAQALNYMERGYMQYCFSELKKQAAANDIAAQFYLAVCYDKGICVQENQNEAFMMYRRVAERGLPDAMLCLAVYYENGIVVDANEMRANEWINRFNKRGGQRVLPDICEIYNKGLKYPQNFALNPTLPTENNVNSLAQNKSRSQTKAQPSLSKETTHYKPIAVNVPQQKSQSQQPIKTVSDVDVNIPFSGKRNVNTFALIIANENYQDVAKVPNALNDGTIFAQYCERILGIPQKNIHIVKDATLNNIKREINRIKQISDVYKANANILVYYAGHGLPDEATHDAYLLPVDGYPSDLSTCLKLDELYVTLGKMPVSNVVVILDACFSGAQRGEGMLTSARGVAIKAKTDVPSGKTLVISAAQNDETAYPYTEKGHGLFTYFLLKKLKDTRGNTTWGELSDYITEEVKKISIVENGKLQTPSTVASPSFTNWKTTKLQ